MDKYLFSQEVVLDEYGNMILTFPEVFLREYAWRSGDLLKITVQDDSIVLTNYSLELRNSPDEFVSIGNS